MIIDNVALADGRMSNLLEDIARWWQ